MTIAPPEPIKIDLINRGGLAAPVATAPDVSDLSY